MSKFTSSIYTENIYQVHTGWRRLIGCLKLQVIFRKKATNYRALLRKMTYEDKASYGSSPPCTHQVDFIGVNLNQVNIH